MDSIKKEDVLALYRDYILPAGNQRAKIAIHMYSQRLQPSQIMQSKLNDVLDPALLVALDGFAKTKPTLAALREYVGGFPDDVKVALEPVMQALSQMPVIAEGRTLVTSREDFIEGLALPEMGPAIRE